VPGTSATIFAAHGFPSLMNSSMTSVFLTGRRSSVSGSKSIIRSEISGPGLGTENRGIATGLLTIRSDCGQGRLLNVRWWTLRLFSLSDRKYNSFASPENTCRISSQRATALTDRVRTGRFDSVAQNNVMSKVDS